MMGNPVNIHEFARRVERVCDFLLSQSDRNGSEDRRVIEDLKEDAADIQFDKKQINALEGLKDYMSGASIVEEN